MIIIRNRLKYALTMAEANMICMQKHIKVGAGDRKEREGSRKVRQASGDFVFLASPHVIAARARLHCPVFLARRDSRFLKFSAFVECGSGGGGAVRTANQAEECNTPKTSVDM